MTLKVEEIRSLSYEDLIEHIRLSKVRSDDYINTCLALREELEARDPTKDYECKQCDSNEFFVQQISGTGGFGSSFFDVQNVKFKGVICSRCTYTEFYKDEVHFGQQIVDFMLGS